MMARRYLQQNKYRYVRAAKVSRRGNHKVQGPRPFQGHVPGRLYKNEVQVVGTRIIAGSVRDSPSVRVSSDGRQRPDKGLGD